MSILVAIRVGKDSHHIPVAEHNRHVIGDTLWCPCVPSVTMIEDDPEFPLIFRHVSLAWRIWGHRRFEPE